MLQIESRHIYQQEQQQNTFSKNCKRLIPGEQNGISRYYSNLEQKALNLKQKFPEKDLISLISLLEDCNSDTAAAENILIQEQNEFQQQLLQLNIQQQQQQEQQQINQRQKLRIKANSVQQVQQQQQNQQNINQNQNEVQEQQIYQEQFQQSIQSENQIQGQRQQNQLIQGGKKQSLDGENNKIQQDENDASGSQNLEQQQTEQKQKLFQDQQDENQVQTNFSYPAPNNIQNEFTFLIENISEELLKQLQKTQSVQEAKFVARQALEYVTEQNQKQNQDSIQKLKGTINKFQNNNQILSKAFINRDKRYGEAQREISNLQKELSNKDQTIRNLKQENAQLTSILQAIYEKSQQETQFPSIGSNYFDNLPPQY